MPGAQLAEEDGAGPGAQEVGRGHAEALGRLNDGAEAVAAQEERRLGGGGAGAAGADGGRLPLVGAQRRCVKGTEST